METLKGYTMLSYHMPKLKKKKGGKSRKKREKGEVDLDFEASFDVEEAKEDDFEMDYDLDMDASTFSGRKGQAGNRSTTS